MSPKPLLITVFSVFSCVLVHAQNFGSRGMVVSDHYLASEIGLQILQDGGNAIDAAVASAFALAVTHPQAGNLGGGGFLVYLDQDGGSTTIDFREKAPLAASPEMFLNTHGFLEPGAHHKGIKSVGVPGTVAGLYLAHQKYGKLSWHTVVQPSVELAEKGFELSWTLAEHARKFHEGDFPAFLKQFFVNEQGECLGFGENWTQPELANTLKLIRDQGKDGFYKGKVAQALIAYMKDEGGLITLEDLSEYEAIERPPLKGSFKGYEVLAMPPPSSGGVAIIELLNIMECIDLGGVEFGSAAYVHFLAEAMRGTFADRAAHLGDPDFNPNMPINLLISKDLGCKRASGIDANQAGVSDSIVFGQLPEGDQTTHLSVIDANGAAVSLTYTLEQSYGCGLGVKELGFLLNNEMGDFNPRPGYTNSGWLIGTPPNLIAPEKRMLSSMSPTIVTQNGSPYLVIGSPGGRTIINTVFQTIFAALEYGMPLQEAIESLKIHHQWMPDQIMYELHKMSPDTLKKLEDMGHKTKSVRQLGRLMGIQVHAEDGVYEGRADSSSPDGAAVGY